MHYNDSCMSKKATIFIDGASRHNPGPASVGVVIQRGKKVVDEFGKYIGETTNNVAEYTACIEALQRAEKIGFQEVEFFSDSELLVRQINGQYSVKDARLKLLMACLLQAKGKFKKFSIHHIPREKNKRADALANQALDELQ